MDLEFAPFLLPLHATRLPPLSRAASSVASIARARENHPVTPAATRSVLCNSEDGTCYRWNLVTNTLDQAVPLAPPTGEAYTPTVIGPDGTVYVINNAVLNAVGR